MHNKIKFLIRLLKFQVIILVKSNLSYMTVTRNLSLRVHDSALGGGQFSQQRQCLNIKFAQNMKYFKNVVKFIKCF